jgi:hypothetical protein
MQPVSNKTLKLTLSVHMTRGALHRNKTDSMLCSPPLLRASRVIGNALAFCNLLATPTIYLLPRPCARCVCCVADCRWRSSIRY